MEDRFVLYIKTCKVIFIDKVLLKICAFSEIFTESFGVVLTLFDEQLETGEKPTFLLLCRPDKNKQKQNKKLSKI